MEQPVFEIVTTTAGAISIRNNIVNEIMHNPVGPWVEANALYIDQSRLAERFRAGGELVIFDVGLGAAANALAALHCARSNNGRLRLISFERDMDLLRFALKHADQFEHFLGFEKSIEAILSKGRWSDDKIDWQLREGDFLELIENEPTRADLVFFDPYSPKKNLDMWTIEAFKRLHSKCNSHGAMVYTYSQATPIRVALLYAGFFVGQGRATGLKEETTQAALRLQDLSDPLGSDWIERFRRSHKQIPHGSCESQVAEIQRAVLQHLQFS